MNENRDQFSWKDILLNEAASRRKAPLFHRSATKKTIQTKHMKKLITLLGISLLLGCLFAVNTQANIIPPTPDYWDYWYTGTPADPTGATPWKWVEKQDKYGFGQPEWISPGQNYPQTLWINNSQNDKKYKILSLELLYANNVPPVIAPPLVEAFGTSVFNYDVKPTPPVYGRTDVTYTWYIFPQPGKESITLPPGWDVGLVQLDIATKCVPEPSTVFAGLSALGLLGLFGWKNRK